MLIKANMLTTTLCRHRRCVFFQVQEPAVLPASSTHTTPSQAAAYDTGTEDIRRRQEELEKKAAELERRERAMQQSVQGHSMYSRY